MTTKQDKSRTLILDPLVAGNPATKGYVDTALAAPVKKPYTITTVNNTNASSISAPVSAAPPSGAFAYLGTKAADLLNVQGSGAYGARWKNGGTATSPTAPWGVKFRAPNSRYVEFMIAPMSASASMRLWVDGVENQILPMMFPGFQLNVFSTLKIDLGPGAGTGVTAPVIRAEFSSSMLLGQVWVEATGTIVPENPVGRRFLFHGDSLTQGEIQNSGEELGSYVSYLSRYLNSDDVWNSGIRGSGPNTTAAIGGNYKTRAADVVASGAEVVVISGWFNDRGAGRTPAQVATDMGLTLDTILTMPNSPIVIVTGSPDPTGGTNATEWATYDNAVQAVCQARSVPYVSLSTGKVTGWDGATLATQGPWITPAIRTWFVGSDGLHPTDLGHQYLASRMWEAISLILEQAHNRPISRKVADSRYALRSADNAAKRTRFMSYCNGGNGSNFYAAQTLTSWSGRIPVRLANTSTRWRWAVRNYGAFSGVQNNPTLNGTGLVFGRQAQDAENVGTGLFVDNQATGLIGAHSIPGDGTWYRSQWFTDPALQFQAGVNYLLAYGFSNATSRSYISGGGKCWQNVNDGGVNAINPANSSGVVSTTRAGSPLEWIVEYETVTDKLCWLFVGDSIMEGIAGPYGTSQATSITSPISDSYPALWAERANALVQNISLASITADNFATVPAAWSRTDLAAPGFDGAVIGVGSNDCANGRTLAQYKASLATIIQNIRSSTGIPGIAIYVVNIMPRPGMTAAQNTVRQQINDWLAQMPYGIKGIIDMDGATTVGTGTQPAIKGSLTTDIIHLSWSGTWRAVSELRNVLPPLQQGYAAAGNLYQVVTQSEFDALPSNTTSPILTIIKD